VTKGTSPNHSINSLEEISTVSKGSAHKLTYKGNMMLPLTRNIKFIAQVCVYWTIFSLKILTGPKRVNSEQYAGNRLDWLKEAEPHVHLCRQGDPRFIVIPNQRRFLPNLSHPSRGLAHSLKGLCGCYPRANPIQLANITHPPPPQSDRRCHRRSGWTETPWRSSMEDLWWRRITK
jgi:hypothetical protein